MDTENGSTTPAASTPRPAAVRLRSFAPWIAGVAVLYLIVACLILQMWRTFVPILDLEVDTRNAVNLIHHGVIPQFGSVASYLVVNAPGVTFGLVPGLLLFPTEPALAEHIDNLLLLALTLAGLFALVAKRWGPATAFYCCAFYMLSTTGLYFAETMRPRAHPVFLVWMLFFIDKWVVEKVAMAFGIAVFIYIAANYWLLESLPALALLVVPWLIYRLKLPKLPTALALVAGLCLWSPHLFFESRHHFEDLHALFARKCPIKDWTEVSQSLLTNHKLEMTDGKRAHDLLGGPKDKSESSDALEPDYEWTVYPPVGMCYKSRKEITFENVKGYWLCPAETTDWWFAAKDGSRWFNVRGGWDDNGSKQAKLKRGFWTKRAWRLKLLKGAAFLLAPFPECAGAWGAAILSAATVCGILWLWLSGLFAWRKIDSRWFSWTADPSRSSLMLFFIAGVGPWVMLMFLVPPLDPDMQRRFMWLWVAISAFMMIFLRHICLKTRPWLAHILPIAFIVIAAWNPSMHWRIAYLFTNHFHPAPANEFNQIVDAIGQKAKADGKSAVGIGYDMAFSKWLICARHTDGMRKVGGPFDIMLQLRHGITNTDDSCEGILPDDDYRVVEFSSGEEDRQTYFNLSAYPRMEVFLKTPNFLVLQKPKP